MKWGKLKIGVIGIPIVLENKNGIIKEYFKPGFTNELRAKLIEFISSNSKKNGIKVDISDLKELIDESNNSYLKKDNLIGISKNSLDKLAEELKENIEGFDFIVVLGGIHTGAYLLYHFSEKVERYDIHEDDNEIDLIFHTSYMKHAIELNQSIEISNHGWQDLLEGIFEIKTIVKPGRIFDIDVDYYASTEYCKMPKEKMDSNFQNIISAIRRGKPKILGLFEYQTLDGSEDGYEKLQNLVWEGILSNAK
jgi:hypothetical protein